MADEITVPSADERAHRQTRLSGPSEEPRFRTQTQRDLDRLLYSSAFQRLGGITQVTASEVGRPFHTRLTHTLKVAQVARRSAERLKKLHRDGELEGSAADLVDALDVDATEAAALAHDLGHPPFGHLSEVVLNKRAEPAGGFEGNAQSFRIVVRLALRSPTPGLDLTLHTLNAMLKYPWPRSAEHKKKGKKWGVYSSDETAFETVRKFSQKGERCIEACLMDWADDITYAVHDVDDFTRAGLIRLDQLASDERELQRFKERLEEDKDRPQDALSPDELVAGLERALAHVNLAGAYEDRFMQRVALRSFGSMLITRYINALSVLPVDDTKAKVEIDASAFREVEALKALTQLYVVKRPSLAVIQKGQAHIVDCLWEWYWEAVDSGDTRLIPPAFLPGLAASHGNVERVRLVTDIVASMTERTAQELYRRMSGTDPGSILDTAARGG